MQPTQHPSSNDVLRAPVGATIEECRPLYITRIRFAGGEPATVSFWKPTAAELALINAGAAVYAAGAVDSIAAGVEAARAALADGSARAALERFVQASIAAAPAEAPL
jgi:hypothetical protein